jgi:hypothetical protein
LETAGLKTAGLKTAGLKTAGLQTAGLKTRRWNCTKSAFADSHATIRAVCGPLEMRRISSKPHARVFVLKNGRRRAPSYRANAEA